MNETYSCKLQTNTPLATFHSSASSWDSLLLTLKTKHSQDYLTVDVTVQLLNMMTSWQHVSIPSSIESRGGISLSHSVSILGWMLTLRIWSRDRDGAPWSLLLNGNAAFTWDTSRPTKAQTHVVKKVRHHFINDTIKQMVELLSSLLHAETRV